MGNRDELGSRMKLQYENAYRIMLPRRCYVLCRVDGRAFHSYTRGCQKPFDYQLMDDIDATALYLCANVQNVAFSYQQSDEISLLLTDFALPTTDQFFGGNLQKMVSVTTSMATAMFTQLRPDGKMAQFDCRYWTMADPVEVGNYFVWRQKDWERNSVSMVAAQYASHKQLDGKTIADRHEIIHANGDNWTNYPAEAKNGRCSVKRGGKWTRETPPIFTQDWNYLYSLVPEISQLPKEVGNGC